MAGSLGVLWRALLHLYEESFLLIRANVLWFLGSAPLLFAVLAVTWLFVPPAEPDAPPLVWPLLLASLVVLVVPGPFSVGLYALAADIVSGEAPGLAVFWSGVQRWWKSGLLMFLIGGIVLGGLLFNAAFYLSVGEGWLQAVSVLWLYAILYWIALQSYLLPLLVAADTATSGEAVSLHSLYKRAAILTLANPMLSLIILGCTAATMFASSIAIPIYPLIAMAYVALVGTCALRQLREKYTPSEPQEAAE